MQDHDLLQRFIFDKVPVRGEYICLETSYQLIASQHAYPGPLRHLLGEALSVVGLLSAIIKFKGRLTVQFRGNGPLKLLFAQCDNAFNIRGLVKWEGEVSPESLLQAFQQGILVIMLDMDNKQNAYQGIVNWEGNSLASSIEGYFQNSEQLATKLWLQVTDTRAAGLLLQVIPGSAKEVVTLENAEKNANWERIVNITNKVDKQKLVNLDFNTLLTEIYPDDEIRIFPAEAVHFKCTCSLKRSEDAIYVLGEKEAFAELETNNSIVVTCEFCNKQYIFDRVDVAKIFADRDDKTKPIH